MPRTKGTEVMELAELIKRVEGLTGADREVDASIADLHRPGFPEGGGRQIRAYTASVDAVIQLIGEKMPGMRGSLEYTDGIGAVARTGLLGSWCSAPTPALALLLAFLRAWEARGEKGMKPPAPQRHGGEVERPQMDEIKAVPAPHPESAPIDPVEESGARPAPQPVSIAYEETSHDCETCGWYVNKRMVLTVAGRPPLELCEDGHFGGADDFRCPALVAKWVMEWLGYSVALTGGEDT